MLSPRRAGNVTAGSPHPDLKHTALLVDFLQVGLKVLVQRGGRFSPTTRLLVERFIPFPAVGEFRGASGRRLMRPVGEIKPASPVNQPPPRSLTAITGLI